jgi:Muramidase (flagellum-specific)
MSASASTFIARIAPIAVQLRIEGSPIFPSVRIAQSGLETGWKIPAWNNLGGYKVGSGKLTPYWRGKIVTKGTWEVYDGRRSDVTAAFRAYDSVEDFFRDQDLLFNNARYARVRTARTPEEQADMLQACGYATDPQYAGKIVAIINNYELRKFDEEAKAMMQMIEELKNRIEQLENQQQRIPAPSWFVQQFGSPDLGGLIADPHFTVEGWRALAVALRALSRQSGVNSH